MFRLIGDHDIKEATLLWFGEETNCLLVEGPDKEGMVKIFLNGEISRVYKDNVIIKQK